MDELNYHHLQYFWVVAKEGSIAQAATKLKVAQPTISVQLKRLDDALQKKLFRKRGRNLELTATGRQVFDYADRIFTIGGELSDILNGRAALQPAPFVVGVQTGISAAIVDQLLRPVLHLPDAPQLVIRTGELLSLAAELSLQHLQLVLSAELLEAASLTRSTCQPLAESAVVLCGRDDVLQRYRRNFPKSLEQAPLLMPAARSPFRRQLDAWFAAHRIKPLVICESDDAANLELLAQAGHGLMPAPQLRAVPDTRPPLPLGPLPGLEVRYFAIRRDEPLAHPGMAAVLTPPA